MENGIDNGEDLELRSMQMREEMSLISCGIDPVNFKSDMVSFWSEDRKEVLGKG